MLITFEVFECVKENFVNFGHISKKRHYSNVPFYKIGLIPLVMSLPKPSKFYM